MSEIPFDPSHEGGEVAAQSPETQSTVSHVDRMAAAIKQSAEALPDDFPPVDIQVFLGGHGTREDVGILKEHIDQIDIVMPEVMAWTDEGVRNKKAVLNDYNTRAEKITLGDQVLAGAHRESPFQYELLSALKGTSKELAMFDVPAGHELETRLRALRNGEGGPSYADTWQQELADVKSNVLAEAQIQTEREEYMAEHIVPAIQEILTRNGRLRHKDRVTAAVILGSAHSAVFHALQKGYEGPNEHIYMNGKPFVQNYFTEGVRDGIFGKELEDDQLGKIWLEGEIKHEVWQAISFLETTDSKDSYIRALVGSFSPTEAEDVFNHAKKGQPTDSYFLELARAKGITVPPASREEALNFIKSASPGQ